MRLTSKILVVSLIIVIGFAFTLCTDKGGSPAQKDSFELWKEQPNEKIVFMSKADSPSGEIYLMDKNGEITRLTDNDRHENNPALSPDGKKVAFHGGDESNPLTWEIYVLDLETGEEMRLTNNNVIDGHPDWSPDGSKIVFASFRTIGVTPSGTADIYVVNVDGTGLVQLTDSPWEDNDPECSPDGSKIVFKSTRNTQQSAREEIYVMDSDGSNVRRLSTTSGWQSDHDPSWSPDSNTIVFSRFEGSRPWTDIADLNILRDDWQELTPWNTYKVDLDGNAVKLTDVEDAAGLPVFSADGSKILYLRLDFIKANNQLIGAEHRLIIMGQDGTEQKQLIPDDRHTPTLEYFDW